MSILISDEIMTATRMSEAEMKQEIAVMLFEKEKLTLAQASPVSRYESHRFSAFTS